MAQSALDIFMAPFSQLLSRTGFDAL
jgi:hypothetical protein